MKVGDRGDSGLGFREHRFRARFGNVGGLHPDQRDNQRQTVGDPVIDLVQKRHRAVALLANFAFGPFLLAQLLRPLQGLLERGVQLDIEV